ncbi:MAG: hypothetical protein ACOY94_04450 [Bacillota bacterium]
MIEYLEKLVEDREYQKALDYAEQLLLDRENKQWDLMVIYSLLCQARFETGEFYGAQVAGQLAMKMAAELESWDQYGKAALWLGVCYDRLRQPENALAVWYDYLAYVPHYQEAKKHHVVVLFNMGLVAAHTGRFEEAIRMFNKAADVAHTHNDHRKVHGIRHALIDAHLKHGHLETIPSLLAKCAHYLRHNPGARDHKQSLMWHLVLRVRFALATRRPKRAKQVASRGLHMTVDPDLMYQFRMLLAQAYEQLGDARLAMAEGVQARAVAIQARRYDFEFEITNYIYGLLSLRPDLVEELGTLNDDWGPSAID